MWRIHLTAMSQRVTCTRVSCSVSLRVTGFPWQTAAYGVRLKPFYSCRDTVTWSPSPTHPGRFRRRAVRSVAAAAALGRSMNLYALPVVGGMSLNLTADFVLEPWGPVNTNATANTRIIEFLPSPQPPILQIPGLLQTLSWTRSAFLALEVILVTVGIRGSRCGRHHGSRCWLSSCAWRRSLAPPPTPAMTS